MYFKNIHKVLDKPSPCRMGLPRLGVSNDGKTQQVEDGLERWGLGLLKSFR